MPATVDSIKYYPPSINEAPAISGKAAVTKKVRNRFLAIITLEASWNQVRGIDPIR